MAHDNWYWLAVYFFAIFGFYKALTFILKGGMDETMSVLRKARECYLELKSWKKNEESKTRAITAVESSAEQQMNLKMVQPKT